MQGHTCNSTQFSMQFGSNIDGQVKGGGGILCSEKCLFLSQLQTNATFFIPLAQSSSASDILCKLIHKEKHSYSFTLCFLLNTFHFHPKCLKSTALEKMGGTGAVLLCAFQQTQKTSSALDTQLLHLLTKPNMAAHTVQGTWLSSALARDANQSACYRQSFVVFEMWLNES